MTFADTDCASLNDLIGHTAIVVSSRSSTPVKQYESDWNLDFIRKKKLIVSQRVHRESITAVDANEDGTIATVSKVQRLLIFNCCVSFVVCCSWFVMFVIFFVCCVCRVFFVCRVCCFCFVRFSTVPKDGFIKIHIRGDSELKQTRASNLSGVPLTSCQFCSADLVGFETAKVLTPTDLFFFKKVLVGSFDSKIYTYSTTFGKVFWLFSLFTLGNFSFAKTVENCLAHDDTVSALRFCNDRLISGGWDTLVRLWTVREGLLEEAKKKKNPTDSFFLLKKDRFPKCLNSKCKKLTHLCFRSTWYITVCLLLVVKMGVFFWGIFAHRTR